MSTFPKAYYEAWLREQSWSYFFTGTFREQRNEKDGTYSGVYTADGARRAGQKFFRPFTSLKTGVLFIEQGSLYGKVHLHGLLRFDQQLPVSAKLIWCRWYDRHGYARVEVPKSQKAVSSYCTKYCTKHMNSETYIVL